MHKVTAFTQLGAEERVRLEVLLQQGLSLRAIAAQLNRAASTLSREVKRNSTGRSQYRACSAQVKTGERHRTKAKHRVFDASMKRFIARRLVQDRLSPELISVEGRRQRPEFVSSEWIYQWIWKMKFSHAKANEAWRGLWRYLRHACRKKKRGRRTNQRGNILHRRWIEQRPDAARKRSCLGHWEADMVLGGKKRGGLLVVVDRKSRKAWLRKVASRDTQTVMSQLRDICRAKGAVKTLTLDNDQSFAEHYRLHALGIKTYFTHPYSAQEKGSVENRIGVIRRFFDKKTDFTYVTPAQVRSVEKRINNRPMRMFHYQTPNNIHEKYGPL
jgi:transposase, IS30 family